MEQKRHTCVICKKKRYEEYMIKAFDVSWTCKGECMAHSDISIMRQILELESKLQVLSLSYITKQTKANLIK